MSRPSSAWMFFATFGTSCTERSVGREKGVFRGMKSIIRLHSKPPSMSLWSCGDLISDRIARLVWRSNYLRFGNISISKTPPVWLATPAVIPSSSPRRGVGGGGCEGGTQALPNTWEARTSIIRESHSRSMQHAIQRSISFLEGGIGVLSTG